MTAHFALGQDAVNLYNQELANQTVPQQLQFTSNPQPSISSDELPQSSPAEAPNHQHLPESHPENLAAPISPTPPPHYVQPIIQFATIPDGIQSHYQDQNVLQVVDVPLPPQQINPSHISPLTTYMYPVNIEQQPYSNQENHLPNIQLPVDEHIPQNINEPQSTPTFTNLVAKTQNLVTSKDVLDINQSVDEHNKNSLFKPNLEHEDKHEVATNGQVQNYLETENQFDSPIIVSEDNPANSTDELGLLLPRHGPKSSTKQINIQIIDVNNKDCSEETTIDAKMINPYVNIAPSSPANVESTQLLALPPPETSQLIYSTTSSTAETSSTERYTEELTISSTPLSNNFLAPIHAAVRLSYDGKHLENCLDLVKGPAGDSLGPQNHQEVENLPKDNQLAFLPTEQPHIQLEFGERFVPKQSKQPILTQLIQQTQQLVDVENQVHEGEADKSADHAEKPVSLQLVDSSLTLEKQVGAVVESTAEVPVEVQQQVLLQYPSEKHVHSTHSLDYSIVNSVQPNVIEQPNSNGQDHHSPNSEYKIPNDVTSFVYEHIPAEGLGRHITQLPYQVQENVVEKIAFYQQPISDGRASNIPYSTADIANKPVEVQHAPEQSKQFPPIVHQYLYQSVENIENKPYQSAKPIERAPVSNIAHVPNHVQYNTVKDLKNPYLVYYTLPYQLATQHHIDQNAHYHHDLNRNHHEKQLFAYIQPTYAKHSYKPKPTHPIYLTSNSLQPSEHKPHHHAKDHHPVAQAPQSGAYHYDRPKPVYGVPLPDISGPKSTGQEHLFPIRHYPQQNYAGSYDYQSNIYRDDYFGPPPLLQQVYPHHHHTQHQNCPPFGVDSALSGSERSETTQKNWKRLNSGKNMQWEYGFKPPMVPSIEIDEFGNPISRSENH